MVLTLVPRSIASSENNPAMTTGEFAYQHALEVQLRAILSKEY
jgi:hypothetical protein